MRRWLALALAAALLLSGCAGKRAESRQAVYLDVFDTVTTVAAVGMDEADFQQAAEKIHETLLSYHRLFDIYNDYEGLNNLKTVNDHAGIAPVKVDGEIIRLLLDCRDYYERTDHAVNVAMGSVLRLWHEARTQALDDPGSANLPTDAVLQAAAEHCGWDTVQIEEEASTVYLTDSEQSLDVGAVAKGWAAGKAAAQAPAGMLISVGGNVCATGPKREDTPWVVGIADPDGGEGYLRTLYDWDKAIVTSGDYQRYFELDGVRYHHIIDPTTLYPAARFRSVTVVCADSGLADALSTALFVLPLEEGKALASKAGAEAMWLDTQGNLTQTPLFSQYFAG